MATDLTTYEQEAVNAIAKWRAQPPGAVAKYLGKATRFVEKPTEWVMDKTVIGKVVQGILEVAMDAGSWTVDEDRIFAAYAKRGITVSSLDDVRVKVSLEEKDRAASRVAKAYRWGAGGEGAAAGAGGLAGPGVGALALAGDVAALTTVACRAAAHHAAIYGYRVETPAERALALSVLSGATAPTSVAKQAALADVIRISKMVAQKKTWEQLEKSVLVKAIQEAAEKLGINLTKAKLGQVIAVVGVFIGGGYNAWYMTRVCEWSYWTYRGHAIADKQAGFPDREQTASAPSAPADYVDAEVVDEGDSEADRPSYERLR